jgi:hypothetical protein
MSGWSRAIHSHSCASRARMPLTFQVAIFISSTDRPSESAYRSLRRCAFRRCEIARSAEIASVSRRPLAWHFGQFAPQFAVAGCPPSRAPKVPLRCIALRRNRSGVPIWCVLFCRRAATNHSCTLHKSSLVLLFRNQGVFDRLSGPAQPRCRICRTDHHFELCRHVGVQGGLNQCCRDVGRHAATPREGVGTMMNCRNEGIGTRTAELLLGDWHGLCSTDDKCWTASSNRKHQPACQPGRRSRVSGVRDANEFY